MRACQCRRGCDSDELVGEHQRLFTMFRALNYDAQTRYLSTLLSVHEPERRTVEENVSRRQCTVKYTLEEVRVCQKTICKIFGVTARRIQYLVEKLKHNRNINDQRGRHDNRPKKLYDPDLELIRQHIASFPLQENHYSRNESSKKCLPPDLNFSKMHRLFMKQYPNSKVSLRTYTAVFKKKFNLRFGTPRSDTCGYCDKLYIKLCAAQNDVEKQSIMEESRIHHMRADAGYK